MSEQNLLTPVCYVDAEEFVVGQLFNRPQDASGLFDYFSPEDFVDVELQAVAFAYHGQLKEQKPCDALSVFKRTGIAGEQGDLLAARIKECCDTAELRTFFDPSHAKLVREAANKRRLGLLGDQLSKLSFNGRDAADIKSEFLALIQNVPTHTEPTPQETERLPYPVECLPAALRDLAQAGAKAIGCDSQCIGVPGMAIVAGMIGTSHVLRLREEWDVYSILWCATVARSGDQKTPSFKLVADPARRVERELREANKKYRATIGDATPEAAAELLAANPRGLSLIRTELSGFLGSFDRYKSGRSRVSSEMSFWLQCHEGGCDIIDRKSEDDPIILRQMAVSIAGTIQPEILARLLAGEQTEAGIGPRFVFTMPQRKAKRWTKVGVARQTMQAYYELLYHLATMGGASDGPLVLALDGDAEKLWARFYDRHDEELRAVGEELRPSFSKLEELPARLALIFHVCRAADGLASPEGPIGLDDMAAAIELCEWHKHETRRVYASFWRSEEDAERQQLVAWIRDRGGSVTPRQVQQGLRRIKTAEQAEAALGAIVREGLGYWAPARHGDSGKGPASRVFKLSTSTR